MTASHQLLEHLGTTADANLYRARHLDSGKLTMLKRFDPANVSAILPTHFTDEYALLQSLDIAGLIKPTDLINEDEHLTMTLDALDDFAGESLELLLERHPRMEWPVCVDIAGQLAQTLAGVHAARIIHRDIRPANILVARESHRILLADVSLATREDQAFSFEGRAARPADWAYLSPEQTGRMNRTVDYRTDFYSLGITLYRMLTGRLPFAANDPLEWMHCHMARIPPAPCDIAPDVPQPVSDIIMKLLAKLPEERYQSAHGLQIDLDRCLAKSQASGCIESFSLGMEDGSDRFQIPQKLYGRDREIALLLTAFDHMAATGNAALLTISGYSGIGKSSLVHELHRPIVRERGYFIAGKFDQYMRDIPYATLTQAFRGLVQQLLAESEARIANWRDQIQEAVGVNGQLIIDVLPQIGLIIGKQSAVPDLPPVEAQHRFRMVFRQFLGVFTAKEHPLALFLDDLQWIDPPSATLIEHVLSHADTRYLLLIGAYRDNEVSAPLKASVEAIRDSGAALTDIKLAPLSVMDLNQLVADTLHADPTSCEPLTRLVFERTEGNPFFFIQFLDSLHKEGLLRWDGTSRLWQWDLVQISARNFADNVADLMVGKLRQLPVGTQQALQLAACLGNKFDLPSIALVSRQSEHEVEQCLSPAIHQGLIMWANGSGKFLHDRIQQAAYSLIPEGKQAALHLQIGRLLSAGMAPEDSGEKIFEIVNQFNRGSVLITLQGERDRVAQFNLVAGKRAKTSTAYASALTYLGAGRALLAEDCWAQQYPAVFAFEFHRAECEFLTGDLAAAEERLSILSRRATTLVDAAAVAGLRLDLYTTLDRSDRSVEVCLEYLRRIGVHWSPHPTQDEVQQEYEQLWRQVGSRAIEDFIDLPLMTDPDWRSTIDVLASAMAPAMFTDQKLYFLIVGRMANISLEHGNSDGSCIAYVWLGMILGPGFGDYQAAFRFGKLGVDLVEQRGLDRFRGKVYLCFGALVNPWTKHVRGGRVLLQRAFDKANECGDLTFAAYSCNCLVTHYLVCGDPLVEIQREAESGLEFARKARFGLVIDIITAQLALIRTLRGLTPNFSSFNDGEFDESRFEQHLEGDLSLALPACWYWIRKLQARFYAGDHKAAIEAALKAQKLLWTSPSFPEVAEYHFHAALAWAAHHDAVAADERPLHLEALTAHHRQIEVWAENCPENFRNRAALVAAEIARLEGRDLEAMRLYEQAIQSARENGFVQNEAVASELAAGLYLARGFAPAGNGYLEQARACYARWGADGKVRHLDERYPQLREHTVRAPATPVEGATQLDLLSVTKASQAISGRIVLDEVIDTLMRIMLENAGAQTGSLLLVRHEALLLAADAHVEQQTVRVQQHLGQSPPETALPAAILNYVRRSRERVLLMDAAQPHAYAADPYFAQRQPKSVLCLPILRQSALIGLLYLENNLVTHAFTLDRVAVMELLASQAAISLENAQLYTDVREREARVRQLVESNVIGILSFDLHGGMSEANDALLHMLGYSRDDLLSGTLEWTKLTPATYRLLDEQKVAEVRATGKCTPYEKEYIRKDGSLVPVLIGAALFEGSQEHGVAFVLDLTERRQAEAERAARKIAEAANTAKSAFLASMSHELRTPLNGILGYAQILQLDQTLGEQQLAGVNVIRQSGEHLLTLINDILDLAKIESGKMELFPADFQLATFVRTIVDIVDVQAARKGLTFICDLAPEVHQWIRADETRLRQVLLNLLSNAVKFTDRGQVTLRVRCVSPSRLRFEVQDTGVGIDGEQLGAIFQPFQQAGEERRRLGGTGLGLAIGRQYIRLMGDDIRVESRPGHGSTFWFELEQVPMVAVETASPMASVGIVTGYAGPRRKVLVADDVAENRAVAVDLLTPLGFDVATAVNGREGLEIAERLRPHLILMDIAMPEMDGLEATRQLRLRAAFKDVPIIALAASVSARDSEKCLAAGMNAFLPKPINVDRLLDQIATLLQLDWVRALPDAAASSKPDARETFVVPPQQELAALYSLARRGNMQDIVAEAAYLIELDQRYTPFAGQLRLLAKSYQPKAILEFVERYLDGNRVQ